MQQKRNKQSTGSYQRLVRRRSPRESRQAFQKRHHTIACYKHTALDETGYPQQTLWQYWISRVVNKTNSESALRAGLHNVEETANIKNFNKESIVLPLGENNPTHKLRMETAWLNSSHTEKNLGITVAAKLNESKRCALITKKAKCTPGYIRSCKASRLKEVLKLCTHLWWGHTEYCIQFWDSQMKRNFERLERVQWRAIETS